MFATSLKRKTASQGRFFYIPNFKNKYGKQSYRSPHEDRIRIENEKVRLPKFKAGIKIIQDRKYKGELRNATISKTTTGKYYISCLVETGVEIPVKKPIQESTAIGIDLGIKTYIATSEGKEYQNPKYLKNSIDRLKILQKRASKKVKGSSNRKKANLKVALLHEKITNQRKDFLHKLSTEITNQYDTICCENLNIEEMVKNHKLAGAVQDAGWGEFVRQLKYKSEWYGKNLLQIPTFQASTKVCSTCGTMKQGLTLADREWDCDNCQTHHDRDINAAKNIRFMGLADSPGHGDCVKSSSVAILVSASATAKGVESSLRRSQEAPTRAA